MPSPPDLNGLTPLQQFIVLIISAIGGVLVWVSGLLKPKADPTTPPNIIALENDRRDAEILDKVRSIMEAKGTSAAGELNLVKAELSALKDDVQGLAVKMAVVETKLERRTQR